MCLTKLCMHNVIKRKYEKRTQQTQAILNKWMPEVINDLDTVQIIVIFLEIFSN